VGDISEAFVKYRAVAVGLFHEGHPVECFSNLLDTVHDWGRKMQAKYPNKHLSVALYYTEERLLEILVPLPVELQPKS
jgi:hypothetical protein